MNLPYNADGPDAIEGAITMIEEKIYACEPTVCISYKEINEQNKYRM